jgi:hypothetical protein
MSKNNRDNNPEQKLEKKVKKAISKSIKYLRKYHLDVLDMEKKERVNDSGVSIMLSYLQGYYGINLGFEQDCNNLYKCAMEYQNNHPRSILDFSENEDELFSTEFLKDIYFQKNNKYPIDVYCNKLEKYLLEGSFVTSTLSNLIPILDLFSQRRIKYLNVGLALIGLSHKRPSKIEGSSSYKKLKKKVIYELINIFKENSNNNPYNLDAVKSYSLLLIALLGNIEKINKRDYQKFLVVLLKTQGINGEWIHSDYKDGNSQITNLLLTIFSLGTLLEYLNLYMIRSSSEIRPIQNLKKKEVVEGFLGFGGGGFLTQRNMDNMWGSPCLGSSIEMVIFIGLLIISGYIFMKAYQKYNI